MSNILNTIIERTNAKKSGTGWVGRCPAHEDKHPSLSIGVGNDGAVLLHCHAGCETKEVVQRLGLSMTDLCAKDRQLTTPTQEKSKESSQGNPAPKQNAAITVATLAENKKLPVEFLQRLGLRDYQGGVEIPYFLQDGSEAPRKRLRTALSAKDGSFWTKGTEDLVPYGVDRLARMPKREYLILVEGESDCWSLWFHEYDALGIPGASMAKTLQPDHLEGIDYLCILNEGDEGGAHFVKNVVGRLEAVSYKGKAYEFSLQDTIGVKDLNELHTQDPNAFRQRLQPILNKCISEKPIYEFISPEGPRPLVRALDPAEAFPIDALGPILEPAARVIREAVQAPDAICANSVLGAVALAVQPFANVEIDGRTFPVSEFFLTIGETGERKSAVDTLALHAHREYEKKAMDNYQLEKSRYLNECEIYKKARDHALSGTKKGTEKARTDLQQLGDPPQRPNLPLLLLQEPTYEGLIRFFAEGSCSAGIFTDEGGRLIGGHALNNDNQIKTAAGICELWDGRAITRVRSSEGTSLIAGRRLSVHIMTQPAIAQMLLSNKTLGEQGFLSRFLVCYPNTTCGQRLYRDGNPYQRQELLGYYERAGEILEMEKPYGDESRSELEPRRITLDPEAKKLWIEFHDEVETQLDPKGEFAAIRGMANKAAEHAARLAGILALFHRPDCQEIHADEMNSGITLCRYYLSEALRLYQSGEQDEELERAEDLRRWLMQRDSDEISLVETYKKGPSRIRNADAARAAMKILQQHGWVETISEGIVFEGKRRREAWRVVRNEDDLPF